MGFLKRIKNSNCFIFFFFSTVIFYQAHSNIPKSCVDIIRDLNKRAKDSYITPIAQMEIKLLFSKEKDSSFFAQKLFEIVLRERLHSVSDGIKKKLNNLIRKKIKLSNEPGISFYKLEADTIYIHNDFPKVEPNYIYYASLIHEIEHAIQYYVLQEKFPTLNTSELDTVALRTQQEIGAMFLEYDYIRLVPENEKRKALEEVRKNLSPQNSDTDKKYFETLLSGNYAKPIEYIKANQRKGRYSVESIEKFFESFGL